MTERWIAVLTGEASWLIPERAILEGEPEAVTENLRERLTRLDRVLLLALTAERKRQA